MAGVRLPVAARRRKAILTDFRNHIIGHDPFNFRCLAVDGDRYERVPVRTADQRLVDRGMPA